MRSKARNILMSLSEKYKGDYFAIINALRQREIVPPDLLERNVVGANDVMIMTIVDESYPQFFRHIPNPPLVLYLKGDITLLEHLDKAIAVIGTRAHSDYGKAKTFEIVEELVKNDFLIVSGLAKGIDGFAHEAALRNGGKTIAVLGSGIDYIYPLQNKPIYEQIANEGLLVSEYPGSLKPEPHFFKARNRIVAALSRGVLIVEAKYKSGTLITVGHALEKGSDIFCVPERAGQDSGCNKLIKDGAYLVETATDIIKLWPR